MFEHIVANPVQAVIDDVLAYIEARPNTDVHIGLTGGRSGQIISHDLIDGCAANPRVHFWFSDERFVPRDDEQRNDFGLPAQGKCHIHSMAASDEVVTAQEAATKYSAEIHKVLTTRFCADNTLLDICILSIGPDGHIASLFAHHSALVATLGVVAITDSPKPPSTRITFTYPTINASRNIWLIATGAEKAQAVAKLRAGADLTVLPAAGVHGKQETRLYLDVAASSQ